MVEEQFIKIVYLHVTVTLVATQGLQMSRPAIIDGDEAHLRRFQHDAPDLFQAQTTALDVIHFTNSPSRLIDGGVSEINTIGRDWSTALHPQQGGAATSLLR